MRLTFKQIVMRQIRPSEILEKNRETIRRLAVKHNTANPRVFGSVVTGKDEHLSDLDILVDRIEQTATTRGTSLGNIIGLENELEDTLGIDVDVLTPDGISTRFRDEVIKMAQPV